MSDEVDEDGLTALEQKIAAIIYEGVLGQLVPGTEIEESMAAHFDPRPIAKRVARAAQSDCRATDTDPTQT